MLFSTREACVSTRDDTAIVLRWLTGEFLKKKAVFSVLHLAAYVSTLLVQIETCQAVNTVELLALTLLYQFLLT